MRESSARRDAALFEGGRVDQVCDRFEAAWSSGQRPLVEEYLTDAPEAERPSLLRELLTLELDLRTKAGDIPTFDEYLRRLPEHVDIVSDIFTEALHDPLFEIP